MILRQKFRSFFLTIGLVLLLGSFTAFTAEDSLATTFLTQPINLAQTQIATMNRVEAIGEDIQGKAQETIGKITGNKQDQIMGKVKQAESKVRNTVEDVKDTSRQQKSKIEAQAKKSMDNSIFKGKNTENQYRNLSD
ncbi:CsbD family protein [Dolichospermum sp. UHCC 0259]|uniref:CsbD family protein n=1 Tax=Dolichospermum sp. UHCC 0259 TaxID=2590010 RepID=UPI001447F388|nr:CsbD family protein [Dolichospermum sp. UHCC 0259]MTJ49439.1 CsbD family protein [Dolichospermum sp. UHCC 0259]